ncbi:hypothetical protein [Streptomyces sp. BP-8]|uniref:Uncharacterized protein n=1 Tax=Streptomyces sirii TaxID=3127701 RepID=A0ABZ2QYB4_9ACTN
MEETAAFEPALEPGASDACHRPLPVAGETQAEEAIALETGKSETQQVSCLLPQALMFLGAVADRCEKEVAEAEQGLEGGKGLIDAEGVR